MNVQVFPDKKRFMACIDARRAAINNIIRILGRPSMQLAVAYSRTANQLAAMLGYEEYFDLKVAHYEGNPRIESIIKALAGPHAKTIWIMLEVRNGHQ